MSSITKTNPNSVLIRFHIESPRAKSLLTLNPLYDDLPVIVFQVVAFDDWLVAEIEVVKEQEQVTP